MKDVIIGAVVDRSGSMGNAVTGVIEGFNTFRQEQARNANNVWLTLALFDDRYETPYSAWNVKDIPDITNETYFVRGSTALNDAFVRTIEGIDQWATENPTFTGKKIVLVITDGYENASTAYPGGVNLAVQELSQKKKADGWEFVVFGANVPAERIAAQLGVSADRAHQFDADARDSRQVFAAYSAATTASAIGDSGAYTSTLRGLREKQTAGDDSWTSGSGPSWTSNTSSES